jgi:hypothetical protein
MQLPIPNSTNTNQILTQWKSIIDPSLANPTNSMSILKNVNLVVGTNVLNHKLGVVQQGWFLTDIQGGSTIYRNAPFNDLTLSLYSSAAVTVSIGVF